MNLWKESSAYLAYSRKAHCSGTNTMFSFTNESKHKVKNTSLHELIEIIQIKDTTNGSISGGNI